MPVSKIFSPLILVKDEKDITQAQDKKHQAVERYDEILPSYRIAQAQDKKYETDDKILPSYRIAQEQDKKHETDDKILRSYRNMFYKDSSLQKRIFILGKAGIGKSTFCKHLTSAWCNQASTTQFHDTGVLKKFQFLFYVSCRFAKVDETILDMINNQLFGDDAKRDIARYVLNHNPEECLILVDGYDEYKGSATSETGRRGDIRGLPSFTGVENCVVLMTSRPWKFFALPTQTHQQSRRFELSGIKNEETLILEILRKLGDANPEQSCIEFQDNVRENNMSELMKAPLMLINAIGIWENNKSLHKSMCMNYINMLKCLFVEPRERLVGQSLKVDWGF